VKYKKRKEKTKKDKKIKSMFFVVHLTDGRKENKKNGLFCGCLFCRRAVVGK
jgi:hypothetical protein